MKKFFKILFFIILLTILILWLVKIFLLTHKYQLKYYNEDKIENNTTKNKILKNFFIIYSSINIKIVRY